MTGCGGTVEVAVPAGAGSAACRAAAASWPATVANQHRVQVRAGPPAVAAWGDPAIIARCGVSPPGPTTLDCIDVSGIDWVVEPLTDGVRFTSYGRTPAIEVLVPGAYRPEPLLLPAFTAAAGQLPRGSRRCR